MIENSGRCIKKILFKPENAIEYECNNFNEDSLNFIRKIYENCPSIEYLTITFPPSEEHFAEFEKLLKICQNIKSLLIIIYNVDKIETSEKILENGKILLEILVRSAPTNLKEIRFYEDFKFSLENLEDFLEKWRDINNNNFTKNSPEEVTLSLNYTAPSENNGGMNNTRCFGIFQFKLKLIMQI
ncbi:hypothetical protein RhiirA1_519438 [Rhizophagus irregularis]|uniref:Uncharacterized protein n=1 Tax=Rhizophagus irregularis TaxID=588596 RepID=A0A2N0SE16_9GLOM|nr:hypothetical protein RhiirA1_519438 [Rhizophagus irregularis]